MSSVRAEITFWWSWICAALLVAVTRDPDRAEGV